MRGPKFIVCLTGILLLVISGNTCNGLCSLINNATTARCYDLDDVKYIKTHNLEILKTSLSTVRLRVGALRDFENLHNLDLSHGRIEQIEPGAFRQLRKLQSLNLSHNNITSLGTKSLDGLGNLRNLNVRRNAIDNIPPAILSLKNLKSLDLTNNPLRCDCANLKIRDKLLSRGVHLSQRILCSSPSNLKGRRLLEPDVAVICMFEEQDNEMQKDEPEGSGDIDDPFEDTPNEDLVENEEEEEEEEEFEVTMTPSVVEIETAATKLSLEETSEATTSPTIATITENPLDKSANSEEMFFSEENEKRGSTTTIATTTESNVEEDKTNDKSLDQVAIEGSGHKDDDIDQPEGSGIEGSGTGVPPISWDVPDDETPQESSSQSPSRTTDAGLLDMIWGVLWSTSAAPDDDNKKELGLEEEEFINVSTESAPASSTRTPANEDIIVPSIVTGNEASSSNDKVSKIHEAEVNVGSTINDAKLGKVKADDAINDEETADASATRQPKKGMGSYVVLAALLAVLGGLIGFAAYKGDFCGKKRKRNDPERGTELKDMRKSLLEAGNGSAQPKIASNGNLENVPLVTTPSALSDDGKLEHEKSLPIDTRYSAIPDVIDPVKPPRKSFIGNEETPERIVKNGNGRSQQNLTGTSINVPEIIEPVCLRNKNEPTTNGKNNLRHSVSSIGTESPRDSPSIRTSPRDSTPTDGSIGTLHGLVRPPLSPGAQRVKITLQENPDSVPKTPILITRTKTGENLVKTP